MNKLVLIMTTIVSIQSFARPQPHYQAYPYVITDKVEDMCITKLSVCLVKQDGPSYFYQFSYGYKESHVIIFSNGKTSRYTVKDVANRGEFVDMADLKTSNAQIASGTSEEKITDEKSEALRACKSAQEVWVTTYEYCK